MKTRDEEVSAGFVRVNVSGSSRDSEPLLADLSDRLNEAEQLVDLPAGYEDVSEGKLAGLKRTLKRKLLQQFQTAYVDVLSRQQSALNRQLLAAVQELTECNAMLARRVDELEERLAACGFAAEEIHG